MWNYIRFWKKDWSLVECTFWGNRYFHGNGKPKICKSVKHEFCTNQICYSKSDANFWNNDAWEGEHARTKNSVCLISNNHKNISNHPLCLVKWNGLKEGHCLNNIAPKDTKICHAVLFWTHKSFVGLWFLDLENETFSHHHYLIKLRNALNLKRFFEILKGLDRLF